MVCNVIWIKWQMSISTHKNNNNNNQSKPLNLVATLDSIVSSTHSPCRFFFLFFFFLGSINQFSNSNVLSVDKFRHLIER